MTTVYLAGQPSRYDDNWKEAFNGLAGFRFIDPEVDSDQSSPETFFPDDVRHIRACDYLIANPSDKPSEATWAEIGIFYALNTKEPGEFCAKLIIVWKEVRTPRWSKPFIDKMGYVVSSVQEARERLLSMYLLTRLSKNHPPKVDK